MPFNTSPSLPSIIKTNKRKSPSSEHFNGFSFSMIYGFSSIPSYKVFFVGSFTIKRNNEPRQQKSPYTFFHHLMKLSKNMVEGFITTYPYVLPPLLWLYNNTYKPVLQEQILGAGRRNFGSPSQKLVWLLQQTSKPEKSKKTKTSDFIHNLMRTSLNAQNRHQARGTTRAGPRNGWGRAGHLAEPVLRNFPVRPPDYIVIFYSRGNPSEKFPSAARQNNCSSREHRGVC